MSDISHPQYLDAELRLDKVRGRFAIPEAHISGAEEDSPWVPFVEHVWIRHLSFDVRTNTAVNVLRVEGGGSLGRHRHRGAVWGYTLRGSWRYLEYDWVARAGDFLHEHPGRSHTLVSDEGMETIFSLNGSLEFLDERDEILEIVDVFWFIDHYTAYCETHGLRVNEALFA